LRIAIVGAGVSGLVAARELHSHHDVTVFESAPRPGGHVHTWQFDTAGGSWAVDSGFIVYNERNYPQFTRLLAALGVETQPSEMSFSVRHDRERLEYNGSSIRQLLVQYRNAIRPAFLRMLVDVLRFNRSAPRLLAAGLEGQTLREVLDRGGYSRSFREWYLLPMGSAIWSIPFSTVLDMPAAFFVAFFANHGMLSIDDRPQWRVVRGGSQRYVDVLVAPFRGRIRCGHQVGRITRDHAAVDVDGERFDRVILACHSDQALALLADPSDDERQLLGAIPYQSNEAVVHTDTSILPRSRRAWAAWNYRVPDAADEAAVVTYNMNILQSLGARETFCVTLNDRDTIDPDRVLGRTTYAHPVFTVAGVVARARRATISGPNRTHYCGAYWGNGFHEDGVVSGQAAAREILAAMPGEGPS
jgi:predicted NAD/FAD-binding protein